MKEVQFEVMLNFSSHWTFLWRCSTGGPEFSGKGRAGAGDRIVTGIRWYLGVGRACPQWLGPGESPVALQANFGPWQGRSNQAGRKITGE